MTASVATTPFGRVRGLSQTVDRHGSTPVGVAIFKGIPYATSSRFEMPVAAPLLGAEFDATTYRALCPQLLGGMERLLGGSRLPASEQCHHLNVFTPACDGARRPVLVWMHGGAFVTGNGATWPSPALGGILGSCHAVDVPFVFHNLDRPGVQVFTGDGADRSPVADGVAGAVLRFASDGKPGWDPYDLGDRPTRRFDAEPETLLDPEPSLRELWAR